jgi:hypothetical protein
MDPGFRERQLEIEVFSARARLLGLRRTGPARIPVVVHIVYNDARENISDQQVHSQIAVLNQDFRATNPDTVNVPPVWSGLVADSMAEFELASTDPDGNPTTGIIRTQTNRISFGANDSVKFSSSGGDDAWPADRYLNVWVCNLSGGILGYAQFPGGPPNTDGVVILHTAFGTTGTAIAPFDKGRTTTHEIGHYLNLFHIWGDTSDCSGTDFVADTPPAQLPNYGTPTFPHISCNNAPNGDMFMNYMDYVDDEAMFMFTHGQVQRMAATLAGPRSTLGS